MSLVRFTAVCAASALALTGCAGVAASMPGGVRPTAAFPNIGYATWNEDEPPYRLYAGDQITVRTPSAPELNTDVTVGPDGRISLPLIDPVIVADRTVIDAQAALSAAYADQLVNPRVEIAVKAATPLKVFIGGEVQKPGVYDMPGAIDALQAVIQAGGFRNAGKRDQVV
ncbi:MAG: polysaccharide biosynthesis/export family protein, partial [Caulobacteraceae bacterium]